jgi:hypothetical protein
VAVVKVLGADGLSDAAIKIDRGWKGSPFHAARMEAKKAEMMHAQGLSKRRFD